MLLTLAAANDVAAVILRIPLEETTNLLRIAVVVVPVVGALVTYRVCVGLRRRDAALRGRPRPGAIRLERNAAGGFDSEE